jgi:pimeloyl-ACP methyl ester carboxylesterase
MSPSGEHGALMPALSMHSLSIGSLLLIALPCFALDEQACRLELESTPAALAQCATLSVPENPGEPAGRRLDLFVARIPALAATPQSDPLVLIAGGPGQSAIDLYLQSRAAFEAVRLKRDIVLLDQRGTGRSTNGFECDVPQDADFETAEPRALVALVARCLAALEHDPRFYTTSVAIEDLERLREALAVPAWNIYGVSYGTRVAQHYLRRYPGRVRTMILDGVVPAELVLGPDIADNAQRALDAILERCRMDAQCGDRFGDLESKLGAVLARVAQGEAAVKRVRPDDRVERSAVTLEQVQGVLRLMSYSATTAALLPLVVDEAYRGRYETLVAQAELALGSAEQSIGFAMHNSVVCSEDVPLAEPGNAYGRGTYLGEAVMQALLAICTDWPIGIVDADFKQPVESDVPVLLLSGASDPATPPSYAKRVIEGGLTNALHVIANDQGHSIAMVGCVPRLIRDFIDSGSLSGLDAGCIEREVATPFFLSLAGPAP